MIHQIILKPFVVYYDKISNKIIIGVNKRVNLLLNFPIKKFMTPIVMLIKLFFHQYTKWGLPSYLGFDKKNIRELKLILVAILIFYIKNIGGLYLHHDIESPWIKPSGNRKLNIWK